jgi:hypothetical protein
MADNFVTLGIATLSILAVGSVWTVKAVLRRLETRKIRRKELIARWRSELLCSGAGPLQLPGASGSFPFMLSPAYASLRPYLTKSLRDRLEAERQIMQFIIEDGKIVGTADGYPYTQLAAEIARLERNWGLL